MPTVRIPLSWPFNPRTPDSEKDQHRINVMDEILGERVYTLKRPGTSTLYTYTAGTGQGMTFFNGGVYSVIGDILNVSSAVASGASGATWTAGAAAQWAARSAFGIANLNGSIFLIGGYNVTLGTRFADVWQLNAGAGWWQAVSSAPWSVRSAMMVGTINDTMFVMGGLAADGTTTLNDVWSSKNGVDWVQVTAAAAWSGRVGASIISADNGMYLLGGNDSGGLKHDVWFTTDGETWTLSNSGGGSPMWSARAFMASYFFDNSLYIVGGIDGVGPTVLGDVWKSTDAAKTWTQLNASAFGGAAYYNAGFTVYNNKLWLVNGNTGAGLSSNVYSSDGGTGSWTLVTASGPTASQSGAMYIAPVPNGVSTYNYNTMWYVGGVTAAPTVLNTTWYAALNNSLTTTTLSPVVANQSFQFEPFNNNDQLLMKNESRLWVISAGNVIVVGDSRYPYQTVPGIVVLGGYAYVMDQSGLIRNCALNDPFHWPLLNAVGADYESDPGVALVKYLNYVVAFGTYTTQFFYDAGIINGSPLRPYLNANMRVGCAAAATVCNIGPTIVWVSRTLEYNRQVMIFNGLSPQVI